MGIYLPGEIIPSYFRWDQYMAFSLLVLCSASMHFCLAFLVCDAETWPTQHHVEVQAIHTNAWVIIVSQIDVFLDPQTKASSI